MTAHTIPAGESAGHALSSQCPCGPHVVYIPDRSIRPVSIHHRNLPAPGAGQRQQEVTENAAARP